MSGPNKAKINEALDVLVKETARRLADPDILAELTTGEITQLVYALNSARDAGQLTKLKIENGKLKKRLGDGKTRTKAGRQSERSWSS